MSARADFGGELVIGADGLPAGVTLNSENMPANLDTVPVVFEAAPTAAVGGQLASLTARHADPAQKVQSRFGQNADLIIGNPGPVRVLEIRGGSDGRGRGGRDPLQDQHCRAEGAAGAERLDEPQDRGRTQAGLQRRRSRSCRCSTRPASARRRSVVIPENQNETLLPMNAAGNAQVAQVEDGGAGHGDGRQWPGMGVVAAGDD